MVRTSLYLGLVSIVANLWLSLNPSLKIRHRLNSLLWRKELQLHDEMIQCYTKYQLMLSQRIEHGWTNSNIMWTTKHQQNTTPPTQKKVIKHKCSNALANNGDGTGLIADDGYDQVSWILHFSVGFLLSGWAYWLLKRILNFQCSINVPP